MARQTIDSGWVKGLWLGAQIFLPLLLVLAWLLWSGMFTPLLLGFGAFSCALTIYIINRMGYFHARVFSLGYNLRLVHYWAWLLGEMVKSSIHVAGVVLTPRPRWRPQIVEIEADDLDQVDQVLLGNSITLTPGTLTLDVRDGKMLVHALTPQGAQSLREGEMKRRVIALRRTERE